MPRVHVVDPPPRPTGNRMGNMLDYNHIVEAREARKAFCASLVDGILPMIDGEHGLGAFVEVFEDELREAAQQCDGRLREGRARPLEGMILAVKDNICIKGKECTAASRLLAGYRSVFDATVVARLREAGALLIGRSNMDEFAMGSSGETSVYGAVSRPFLAGYVPGGSSSGSAAAVAAGYCHAALGSDTGGPVRQPAAYTGTVGCKPTWGRVSRYGLVAFASSCDQIGPIGATVRDCARVLEVIAGHDPRDASSAMLPVPDLQAACGQGVRGLRVGIPGEFLDDNVPEEYRAKIDAVAAALRAQGAVISHVSLPLTPLVFPAYFVIAATEAASNLAR